MTQHITGALMFLNIALVSPFLSNSSLNAACSLEHMNHEMLQNLSKIHAPTDKVLAEYIAHFPLEQYRAVHSASLGCYLVEPDSQDMIKKVIREGWHREWHMARLFGQYALPGSVVLDIGAHIGTHVGTLLNSVGPYGKVYAFEPQLKIFTELMANAMLNHWENVVLRRLAVGNANKLVYMNPSCITNEGGVSVGAGGDPVQMVKIDDLGLSNISLMKIDVEGLEMDVLDGARETIGKNRPVIFIEIMGHIGYASADPESKRMIDERIEKIEGMGYAVSHLGIADFLCIPR